MRIVIRHDDIAHEVNENGKTFAEAMDNMAHVWIDGELLENVHLEEFNLDGHGAIEMVYTDESP